MLNSEELHKRILYTVVRVRTEKAGGSGIIIYSKPDPLKPKEYLSFLLTCSHVVDDAITIKKSWESVLKKNIDKEYLADVTIDVFDYIGLSHVNSANTQKASIIAYDKEEDLALLKLDSPRPMEYVAPLVPRDKINDIKLFAPVWATGCSLLHDTLCNAGYITYLSEKIENKLYWMSNANSIFGNSGGAVFLAETGELLGVSARITTIQLGFGVDVITWMGFFIAPQRLYKFFERQDMQFIYNPADTFEAGMKRRANKVKESLISQKDTAPEEIRDPYKPQ